MRESRNPFLTIASTVALAIILGTSLSVTVSHAQTFTVLYNFGGVLVDPQSPQSGPITQGRDGNFYFTTLSGGSAHAGTIFKITPTGAVTVLSNLGGIWGSTRSGLTLGRDGNFYGVTTNGGSSKSGTVFRATAEGKMGLLYSFSGDMDGGNPWAPPIQGADGSLYGTTYGPDPNNFGTIYRITSHRQLSTIYQFTNNADGSYPLDPLLQATDGSFYGTASHSAFKISSAGAFTILGQLPGHSNAPLIQASNGNFFGVTDDGGTYDGGTVFQMTRAGKITVLRSFNPASEAFRPYAGLVQATDGNFYGATFVGGLWGVGTIYRLSPTGDFSVLHTFDQAMGGSNPLAIVQHTNGILYGTTTGGGAYGWGVFFSLDIGAPPFVRLVTTFGKAGRTTIGILGQGFTGTTDVSFNGIPATFTFSSDTYLEATLPVGATTGFVTVTTPTGTLTSNQQIQVRQ